MLVIDFEQVNAPREAFSFITIRYLMVRVNNKNTRKKCEICSEGNYSKKNVLGEFDGVKFSEGVVIVERGIIQG